MNTAAKGAKMTTTGYLGYTTVAYQIEDADKATASAATAYIQQKLEQAVAEAAREIAAAHGANILHTRVEPSRYGLEEYDA